MRRPSFQFYPADWIANPNLQRCSFAERGVWLAVLCLMHDQEPYGILRWPLKDIAQAVRCRAADLRELARKGVLKGSEDFLAEPYVYVPRSGRKDGPPVVLIEAQPGPIWYSSRMVKDEYVRAVRGEGGGNGAALKATPKGAPKPPFGEGLDEHPPRARAPRAGPSSSSSSSGIPPVAPQGGAAPEPDSETKAGPKAPKVTLRSWLEAVRARGEPAIPEDDPVQDWAEKVGLPSEFVELGWRAFKRLYLEDRSTKRYTDWRVTFRLALRGNWLKLWWLDGHEYRLTTVGEQVKREFECEGAAA
ncbi:hypothetical protein [Rubrivivax benzoatilyticus]|uniref:hypothetical protein n=1 Tax=Rubrivivax benzoatilyticus TaxID=316997 RepID=UPI00020A3F85|nr:hypothetical protein [Rubrivivax benzoatilyticus]EGJ11954.1 hypothetical protein RBXJA2T_16567 [Rubrivivax benzoatilyticus JA2 = ATCC BAA-35]